MNTPKKRQNDNRRPAAKPQGAQKGLGLGSYYLIAYNLFSALAWSYPLVVTVLHLCNYDVAEIIPASSTPPTLLSRILAFLAHLISLVPIEVPPSLNLTIPKLYRQLPASFIPYVKRAMTTYDRVGPAVKWIQTAATLEVFHCVTGLVRSPLVTTLMQVSSRLWLVWGIVDRFESTHSNPIYASMILAWSFTEVLRYTFYVFNIVGFEPYPLVWLRYTTFYVLYIVGAGSEAFLMLSTVPIKFSTSAPYYEVDFSSWTPFDYLRGGLFLTWWPSLYMLYTHMMKQRRRVLGGGGRKLKAQ